MGGLELFVICDYCDSALELNREELAQGWYTCPECDQLSHLPKTDREPTDSLCVPNSDLASEKHASDWVQLMTASGAQEAALEVAYLRAHGVEAIVWQGGSGQAGVDPSGLLGAFRVMVRKDQEQLGRSLRGNIVQCSFCRQDLEITDLEVTQGWFICPSCHDTTYLRENITCMVCGSQQTLKKAERQRGWYLCHECDRLTPLIAPSKLVQCGYCEENIELSDQEAIQGWFFCPSCQRLGRLVGPVTCLSCGSSQDLDESSWQQRWYRCRQCDQVTKIESPPYYGQY